MCVNCESDGIGRRDLMKFGAAAAIALGLGGASPAARAAEGAPTALSPGEALAALKAGNERLCEPSRALQRRSRGRAAAPSPAHQAPWATIVSCADSRVPPELIFGGHGVGELFVARDAGNLVDVETLGTIEYGAAVLGSPLIVILAHYRLRRGESRLRRGDQERNLSWRHRPDDRADRAGGACGAQRPRRFRQQRRQGEREADRGDSLPSCKHDRRRSGRRGKGEDRRGDL